MASLKHVMFDTCVEVHKTGRQTMTVAGQSALVVLAIDHQRWHAVEVRMAYWANGDSGRNKMAPARRLARVRRSTADMMAPLDNPTAMGSFEKR